jgi:hypothetical protein
MTLSSCESKGLAVSGVEMREVTAKIAGKRNHLPARDITGELVVSRTLAANPVFFDCGYCAGCAGFSPP